MNPQTTSHRLNTHENPELLLEKLVELAFLEDFGNDCEPLDLTSEATVPADKMCRAEIISREEAVIAGLPFVEAVMKKLSADIKVEALVAEGTLVKAGTTVARLEGRARDLLKGERLALNILQRVCGVATQTRRYVEIMRDSGITVLDTRKTSPGMRVIERYAVKAAGGTNHRFGLFDAILIKDNHITAAGGVKQALQACKAYLANNTVSMSQAVEVEVASLTELEEALSEGIERVLLDNMPPDMVRASIAKIKEGGRPCFVEVSGGVNLDNLKSYLIPGVNAISTGALTHSARNIDLSLEFTLS